jgi:hypothetical protein
LKDKEQEMKESMGDSSAAGLRRYQFYFTRFENHQKSIKFAERIRVDAGMLTSRIIIMWCC